MKTASSPSDSASSFTANDPGTTIARIPALTVRPRTTAAAARRSSTRAFVHEPMNTVSTLMSRIGVPALRPMYCSARVADSAAPSSVNDAGSGTMASIVVVWAGFVPHETLGFNEAASMKTSLSNVAPSSVGRARHASSACSHAAPFGANGRPSR